MKGGLTCTVASNAYRRGVRDMLAAAKEHADCFGACMGIDWRPVEAEAARLTGEKTDG